METKWRSEWLDWHPSRDGFAGFEGDTSRESAIIQADEVGSQLDEIGSVGFEGSTPWESPIIQPLEGTETRLDRDSKGRIIEKAGGDAPTKPTKPATILPMPPGVKLIEWNPKHPPVALSSIAIVNDVDRYIKRTLRLLGLALAAGARTDGRRVCGLVDKLEQCGVIVKVYW